MTTLLVPTNQARRAVCLRATSGLLLVPILVSVAAAQAEGLFPNGAIPPAAIGEFLLGDVSNDGMTDLLEIGPSFDGTAVRLGRPDGTFGPMASYPSGPYQQLIADFTGDGIADVLTTDPNASLLSVLPGLGDGTFGAAITTPVDELDLFASMVAGDIDEDGDLDLALLNGIGIPCKCADVLDGLGNGAFITPSTHVTLGKFAQSLLLADGTGDGHLDLLALVSGSGTDHIAMAPGDGAGGFGTALKTALPFLDGRMIPGDMDGDGLMDLVVTGWDFSHASLVGFFQGTGSSFTEVSTVALIDEPPQGYALPGNPWLGDIDADGQDDLLVSVEGGAPFPGGTWFLRGTGGFTFAAPALNDTDIDSFSAREFFADVNADGKIDIAADDLQNLMVSYGLGDGTFEQPGRVEVGVTTQDIATGDLDADGNADLVVATEEPGPGVIALLGQGDGTFAPQPVAGASSAAELLVADLTGDGLLDALTWSTALGSSIDLLAGDGHGAFVGPTSLLTGAIRDVDVGDLNLDGQLDVASSRPDLGAVLIQLSNGGGFAAPVPVPAGEDPGGILLADLDADGLPDLAVTAETLSAVLVFDGFGGSAFGSPKELPAYDGPRDLVAADLDADGDLDLATTCYRYDVMSWGYYVYIANVVHWQLSPDVFSAPDIMYPPTFTMSDEILVDDLDRDGRPDILTSAAEDLIADLKTNDFDFLHGSPDGWEEQIQVRTGSEPSGIATADFDQDGFTDVAVSQAGENDVRIHLNRSTTWATLGHASSPTASVPLLTGSGDPIPDQLVSVTGSLMPPPAPGMLFVGLAAPFAPYQGGVLVPSPDVVVPVRAEFTLSERWPKGIPAGTPVYLQAWFQSLATGEVSATNALVTIAQ